MHYLMHIFKRRISHEYSSCSCASLEPMALHTRMARRQDEMGHWSKLAWQLVVPSHPGTHWSIQPSVCAGRMPSSFPQHCTRGETCGASSRLSASAGTGTSPCTRAFTLKRLIVFCVTTRRVTCLQTWHMIFKAINFISSLGCAAPQSLQQAAKLSRSLVSAQKYTAVWKQPLRLILFCG